MLAFGIIVAIFVAIIIIISFLENKYNELETAVLKKLGFRSWNIISYYDFYVTVKSRQTLVKYDEIRFFKENKEQLNQAKNTIKRKNDVSAMLQKFLYNNEFQKSFQYHRVEAKIKSAIENARCYRVKVTYISSAGNNLGEKDLLLDFDDITEFERDPSLLMSKGEYNNYIKAQQKEILDFVMMLNHLNYVNKK